METQSFTIPVKFDETRIGLGLVAQMVRELELVVMFPTNKLSDVVIVARKKPSEEKST